LSASDYNTKKQHRDTLKKSGNNAYSFIVQSFFDHCSIIKSESGKEVYCSDLYIR